MIQGSGGTDVVVAMGGSGNDDITASIAADTLDGDDGNDVIDGREGFNEITGGLGNDTLVGEGLIYGGSNNDQLFGGAFVQVGLSDMRVTELHGDFGDDTLGGYGEMFGGFGNNRSRPTIPSCATAASEMTCSARHGRCLPARRPGR